MSELSTNPELEPHLQEIEQLARNITEIAEPETRAYKTIHLGPENWIDLRSQSEIPNSISGGHTGLFLTMLDESEQTSEPETGGHNCPHKLRFSFLYHYAFKDRDANFGGVINDDALLLMSRLTDAGMHIPERLQLALGSVIQQINVTDLDEFRTYDLSIHNQAAQALLEVTNQELADGLIHTRKMRSLPAGEFNIGVSTSEFSGSIEHQSEGMLDMYPFVEVKVVEDGAKLAYTYLADRFGAREIRTQIADPMERDSQFATNVIRDDDGKIVFLEVDGKKKKQSLAEERAMGLYQVDPERVTLILRALRQASTE